MSKTRGIVFQGHRYWAPYGSAAPAVGLPDDSRFSHDGVFTNATWTQEPSGLWVNTFNGATAIITVGDILNSVQSALMWIYPDDITTRSIVDFDGGTHSIEIDGASDITATGWAAPVVYVNGAVATAVTITWNFIAVTTTTAFLASALIIGEEASFFDGRIGLIELYNYVLSQDEINRIYQSERSWFDGA